MKWWQLLWLLNGNIEWLDTILADPKWAKYHQWLVDQETIRNTQRRDILDAEIPRELCQLALAGCKERFLAENGYLYGGFPETATEKLDAVEAYLRYGGCSLVDAVDRGKVGGFPTEKENEN